MPAGTNEVQFMDVAALIDPTTVHLKSLTDPAGLRILEQNYEYDLLSSQKLLEKYVGPQGAPLPERRDLSRGDPAVDQRPGLRDQRPDPPGRTTAGSSCPSLPDNLVSKPTLVWLLRNQTARPQRVEASYLTSGHHVEGRLRACVVNARRHARGPHRLGDDRQQERRDLRQRRAQARGRRRQPRAGRPPRSRA